MITLYAYAPAFGLRNASPFCLKAEMALNHLELDYRIEIFGDPRKAPKGKLPFIELGGERVADSELIVERLDRETGGGLLRDLTRTETAQGTAFARLAEEHLYWLLIASRWLDDAWWPNVKDAFFGALPRPVGAIVGPLARRQVRRACHAQGLGRHSLAEQRHLLSTDLRAISNVVESSEFIAGPRLTVFDFAVAAQLSSMLDNRPATWATAIAAELGSLQDYADRIQQATGVYGRQTS